MSAYDVLVDPTLTAGEARARAGGLLEPLATAPIDSRAGAERAELALMSTQIREIMSGISGLPFSLRPAILSAAPSPSSGNCIHGV